MTDDQQWIQNFHADHLAIDYGGSVDLIWQGPDKSDPNVPFYSLEYTTPDGSKEVPVNDDASCVDGTWTYTMKNLTASTAFRLTATLGAREEAGPLVLVTVTNGDVSAGDLTANGHVSLLQQPTTYRYNKSTGACPSDSVECRNKEFNLVQAPTDGYLVAVINSDKGDSKLTVKYALGKSNFSVSALATAPDRQDTLFLPVAKDAVITIKADTGVRGQVTWCPLGKGGLVNTGEPR